MGAAGGQYGQWMVDFLRASSPGFPAEPPSSKAQGWWQDELMQPCARGLRLSTHKLCDSSTSLTLNFHM